MQVEVVRSLCRQCGLPDKGSKVECVLRLQKSICNRNVYNKVFSKIWGASGVFH